MMRTRFGFEVLFGRRPPGVTAGDASFGAPFSLFNQSFLSSGKNRIVRSRFTALHLLFIPHPEQQATPRKLPRETVLLIPENLIQLLRVHRLHVVLIDPDCLGPRAVLFVVVSR